MKIEKFLTWIQEKLLNYPDIDFKTVKMFMDKFECLLSTKEQERWNITLQMIKEFSLKQISLDSIVYDIKVEHLSNALDKLKKDDKLD